MAQPTDLSESAISYELAGQAFRVPYVDQPMDEEEKPNQHLSFELDHSGCIFPR